jgi:hypothetical protein
LVTQNRILERIENMKTEDILSMAQEAKFFVKDNEAYSPSSQEDHELTEHLERFAALVAAAEREACAGLAERRMLIDKNKDKRIGHHHACKTIAEDIRSRGQA